MSQLLLKNRTNVILPSIVGPDYVNHWKDESFTNEQHHNSLESTSSSSLKLMADSPYTYLSSIKDRQNGLVKKESKSMKFGTLCHLAILEPERFKKLFVLSPKFDLRTKIGKEDKEIFMLELSPGAVVLDAEEYENLMGVIDAILNHEEARGIFTEGVVERSGFFRDPKTGILCRARHDFISTKEGMSLFVDLKTAKDSSYDGFQKQIFNLRYDIQLAMYREAIKEITGSYPEISGWVVVENKRPYEVAIFVADEAILEVGTRWYGHCLDRLKSCIDSGKFPQRQIENENMVAPDWIMRKTLELK